MAEDPARLADPAAGPAPGPSQGPAHAAAVNPALRKTAGRDWRPEMDGSTPLDTVSVQPEETPSVWPRIWGAVAIGMIVLTLLLVLF